MVTEYKPTVDQLLRGACSFSLGFRCGKCVKEFFIFGEDIKSWVGFVDYVEGFIKCPHCGYDDYEETGSGPHNLVRISAPSLCSDDLDLLIKGIQRVREEKVYGRCRKCGSCFEGPKDLKACEEYRSDNERLRGILAEALDALRVNCNDCDCRYGDECVTCSAGKIKRKIRTGV